MHTEELERQRLHHKSLINTFRILALIVEGNRNPLKDFIYGNEGIILTLVFVFGFFLIVFILR